MTAEAIPTSFTLLSIPLEVQINILTYLRAFDLSAVQQTCRSYNDPDLIHEVVTFASDHLYGDETQDNGRNRKGKYTLENLRNIELTVVARALSSPEPKTGFYVSKSWVKKTLLWLEKLNEPAPTKKLSKKQQRQRERRLSDVHPPWPNVNSDILCCHENLQRCSAKSARARRRLMDKQAWKILRKLYPDSTQLESVSGECLQCLMETETARKSEEDRVEKEKLKRKEPLSNPHVRRFYTRTRGVPTDCLVSDSSSSSSLAKKCPLVAGTYYILPRGWCHQWRRYIKTGDVPKPPPPESSMLLCDAHKLTLLPPHLEEFLSGETSQLLSTIKKVDETPAGVKATTTAPHAFFPLGASPPPMEAEVMNALQAAGLSRGEMLSQQMAMLQMQQQQQQQQVQPSTPSSSSSRNQDQNERLDRENHVVIELVTPEELSALRETGCWPKQQEVSNFSLSVTIQDHGTTTTISGGGLFSFSTLPCRDCDPTGSRFTSCAEIKYRRKRWEPKKVEQKRIPATLEY
eukprot:scaffold1169_cov120-Cylindrotheca_fusiformis.AAC.37